MTKMRFGIMAGQGGVSWREVEDMWRFLDRETKFHSAWLPDHFVAGDPGGDFRGNMFEGWTALAALAATTDRIRLGMLVTGVTYRNPALLAKMAVTVDHISDGRLELGIGAAWHEPEHRMFGWPYPSDRERSDRLEEAVQLIRALFETDGPVNFEGKHYQLRAAIFDPKPVQRPRPPILIGGGGEKRTLRTLARHGDIMNVAGTPEEMRRKIEVLERHCRDAGRDPAEIEKTYWGPVIVSDNPTLIDRVATLVAAGSQITPEEAKRRMPIGPAAHVRGIIEEYAAAGVARMIMMSQPPWKQDIYRRVNDEVVEAFA
jgi:F420-dependent oxidoreductase-like protein